YYATFATQNLAGVQLYFLDPHRAPLTAINIYGAEALKKLAGLDIFAIAPVKPAPVTVGQTNRADVKPTKPKDPFEMFDKVNGTDATRKALQAGTPARDIVASWKPVEEAFRKKREKYLLYK
ncbi:MAG: hypothetical protein JWQ71_4612, partial [Pedosphaera sp.]|nr:hypothetical protein [Pedosphaera sp.]